MMSPQPLQLSRSRLPALRLPLLLLSPTHVHSHLLLYRLPSFLRGRFLLLATQPGHCGCHHTD
jgi:hypothetical protein